MLVMLIMLIMLIILIIVITVILVRELVPVIVTVLDRVVARHPDVLRPLLLVPDLAPLPVGDLAGEKG